MGTTGSDERAFVSVYEFCGNDLEIYLEILVEIRLSLKNLVETLTKADVYSEDEIRFIRHKMKSTFRILKDEYFKQILDDFTEGVISNDPDAINTNKTKILEASAEYDKRLNPEIETLS